MDKTFDMEQIAARDMKITMYHGASGSDVNLVGNPLKMSETPVSYDLPPPVCGEHTENILHDILNLSTEKIAVLKSKNIIA